VSASPDSTGLIGDLHATLAEKLAAIVKHLRGPLASWQAHNSSMVANLVAIGGLVGVIASVGLLALQTRTLVEQAKISNAIARATVISNASSNLHQAFQIFIERPELRPYFYESKDPPLRGYKRARIIMAAEMLGDIFEDGLVAHRLLPTSRTSDAWARYCGLVLTASPIMNEIMQRNSDWWPRLREAAVQNPHL
jgi:hypothetical protein